MRIPRRKSVLTRITSTFLHAFFPSTGTPHYHSTPPTCQVVLTAGKWPLLWASVLRVHDTTGTLSSGGVVCYQLRWKLETDMEETGIQNYGLHFM